MASVPRASPLARATTSEVFCLAKANQLLRAAYGQSARQERGRP